MLIRRVASAAAGIPLLLGATYLGRWPLALLTAAIALLATEETAALVGARAALPRGFLRGWAVAVALIAGLQPEWAVGVALPLAFLMLFLRQTALALAAGEPAEPRAAAREPAGLQAAAREPVPRDPAGPHPAVRQPAGRLDPLLAQGMAGTFALVYPAFLLSFLAGLRAVHPYQVVWLVLGIVWATDTLAYFGGRLLGGLRLAPGLSPGKTVSGAVVGILGGVAAGLAAGGPAGLGTFYGAALGAVVAFAAQWGDLFESLLKRVAGVKDSGRLIPGHGGVLDRFDSLAFALPAAYYFLLLSGR